MESFESIVQALKKKPGLEIGFAAYESKGSPIRILADKKKAGKSLEGKAKKSGTLIASGTVTLSEDGKNCQFSCGLLKSGFKVEALKPYFKTLTVAPLVEKASGPEEVPAEDNEHASLEDDGGQKLDETLVTIWNKRFDKALIEAGVDAELVGQFAGLSTPVTLSLPKFFIRALKEHNAEAFAQRIVDTVNATFDAECAKMKAQIATLQENPELSLDLNQFVVAFQSKSEKIVEAVWDKFVARYEVTKGFGKKKFRAIVVPVVAGISALVGTGASIATGNVAGGVAGTIAALRATAALVTALKNYYGELEANLKKMETALERLAGAYTGEKTQIAEHAQETGLVVLNAFSGGKLAKTFSAVKDEVDIFEPRLALAERKLDDVMGQANTLIEVNTREMKACEVIEKKLSVLVTQGAKGAQQGLDKLRALIANGKACGEQVANLLDKIADGNARYRDMGERIEKLKGIIVVLNKGTAMTMEKVEKVMTFVVNFVSTASNLSVGVATAGMALDPIVTTIGGLADTHDMLSSEFDALEVTLG